MNNKSTIAISILFSLFTVLSCESLLDLPDPKQFEELIVLNANLESGADNVRITLNLSASIDDLFDEQTTLLSGATVILKYNSISDTLVETAPGIYSSTDTVFEVKSGATYSIEAYDNEHTTVTAFTTVPAPIELYDLSPVINPNDSLVYVPAGEDAQFLYPYMFSFKVRALNGGSFPAMIRLVNEALDARAETMVTEDDTLKAFLFKWEGIGDDSPLDITNRILTKSEISFNSVDTDAIYKLGWIYYTFYGPQRLEVFALDQGYYNYHVLNLEGPPTDPNYLPESNITGGYGLFSSSYKVSLDYYLLRPN